jgi:hypothetical protein
LEKRLCYPAYYLVSSLGNSYLRKLLDPDRSFEKGLASTRIFENYSTRTAHLKRDWPHYLPPHKGALLQMQHTYGLEGW